jgi:hypothetical protein
MEIGHADGVRPLPDANTMQGADVPPVTSKPREITEVVVVIVVSRVDETTSVTDLTTAIKELD